MVELKPSSILAGLFIAIIGIVIFKYADSTLTISSSAGQAFAVVFFLVVFYLVFRIFRKRD